MRVIITLSALLGAFLLAFTASETVRSQTFTALNYFEPCSAGAASCDNVFNVGGSMQFEGATTDGFETSFAVNDPGADVTVTFPDGGNASYAIIPNLLTTNEVDVANSVWGTSNDLTFEGATADAFETILTPVDPTVGDSTLTFPNTQGVGAGFAVATTCKFDVTDGHDSAVGTSTCTVEIPAGSVIFDIVLQQTVVWDAGTSTVIDVGDDDDADGWFSQVNLQAAGELNVGETLSAAASGDATNAPGRWGGANGAYLVEATGRMGQAVAAYSGNYVVAATEVIGALTTVGTVPTTGTTFMTVIYATGTEVAATYAAT